MKIKLNVRVNLTDDGKLFTIWPRSHAHIPGIEFYTGQGSTIDAAVDDLFLNLPACFTVDDEITVITSQLEPTLVRPFEIVRSDSVRVFSVC